MQNKDYVTILNNKGNIIDKKPRSKIDKIKDILWQVNITVINSKNQVFATKPKNSVFSKGWYSSAAGLVRYKEDPNKRAKITIKKELNLNLNPIFYIQEFHNFNNIKRLISIYYIKTDLPIKINKKLTNTGKWIDIKDLKKEKLSETLSFVINRLKR